MSEEHSNDHIEDVVLCSQNCDETNSPKNEKDEKDFKNFSSESSDSYYKNKFRLKKNSIEIKKKSLLKSKLKNDDIQTIIKNDPILSKLNKTMTTDEEIFDLANKKENKTKFKLEKEKKEKKVTNDSTNNKNNSVLFLNENQENKNQHNHNNKIKYELNEETYDINNISEEILKKENHHTNIEYNEKVQDQDNTLNINQKVNKIQLNSTKKQKQKEKTKKEIKLNEQNENKKNNQNFNSSILNEIKKNKELSPLSLIKKHGRLINNIEEIYNSNCEQIQNVRDEFAELKNDLNKIMNLINIGILQTKFKKKNDTSYNLPFKVSRTISGNLPVYPKIRRHGTIVTTIVRHIYGDIKVFKDHLRNICEAPVREHVGYIEVKGLHTLKIKQWLQHIGF